MADQRRGRPCRKGRDQRRPRLGRDLLRAPEAVRSAVHRAPPQHHGQGREHAVGRVPPEVPGPGGRRRAARPVLHPLLVGPGSDQEQHRAGPGRVCRRRGQLQPRRFHQAVAGFLPARRQAVGHPLRRGSRHPVLQQGHLRQGRRRVSQRQLDARRPESQRGQADQRRGAGKDLRPAVGRRLRATRRWRRRM